MIYHAMWLEETWESYAALKGDTHVEENAL
jgi:hypothetical protein